MGRRALGIITVVASAALAGAAGAASPPVSTVNCPLAGRAVVNWAFSASATGFYVHGRGTYTPRKAAGTICAQQSFMGHGSLQLVLKAGGRGALTRGIANGGVRGARLLLPMTVSATDASACAPDTRGTLTLFTSYNGARRDRVKLQLGGGCAPWARNFSGGAVHVAIPH